QIASGRNSEIDSKSTFRKTPGSKRWSFTIGWGGGMNCWWAQAPRLHPADFLLHSRHGVGIDWPLTYQELEPHYARAEDIMSIAGDESMGKVLPRSTPFPQPAHRMSTVDEIMRV